MNDFSVADIEKTLVDIHNLEQSIAAAKNKRDQAVAYFKQRIDNADEIFDDETADARTQIAVLSQSLEFWFNQHPPDGKKSLKFAGGSFGYRKSSTKFFLNGQLADANNSDLFNLCKAESTCHRFIKTKEYLDWAALKQNLDFTDADHVFLADTGEIIDGLRAQRGFYVKTS